MIRLLLIILVVGYAIYKVGSFLFRLGVTSGQVKQFMEQKNNPQAKTSTKTKKKSFDKGDYIDFEEVK